MKFEDLGYCLKTERGIRKEEIEKREEG